jgi:hypothetical protein
MLKDGLNAMRTSKNVHGSHCHCNYLVCTIDFNLEDSDAEENPICYAHTLTYKSLT